MNEPIKFPSHDSPKAGGDLVDFLKRCEAEGRETISAGSYIGERTYNQAELDSAVQAARSAARQEGADECNRLHAATHDAVEADFARQLAGARADEAKWWIEYGFYDDAPSDMGRERLAKLEAESAAPSSAGGDGD